ARHGKFRGNICWQFKGAASDGSGSPSRTIAGRPFRTLDTPKRLKYSVNLHLLYSEEFYGLAKQHLKPNGILQAWFPRGEPVTGRAVLRSLRGSFPHVQCFASLGDVGTHVLASMEPITMYAPAELAYTMPIKASEDLLEGSASRDLAAYPQEVLSKSIPVKQVLNPDRKIRITDDHPNNEY